jgi:hypothetical protein
MGGPIPDKIKCVRANKKCFSVNRRRVELYWKKLLTKDRKMVKASMGGGKKPKGAGKRGRNFFSLIFLSSRT